MPDRAVWSFLVVVCAASLWRQQHVDTSIAKPDTGPTSLPDALFQCGLGAPTRFVAIGSGIEPDYCAGPADRYLPIRPQLVDQRSLPTRPQSFRLMTSCSISLSSGRSTTIFFSRAYSFSRSLSQIFSDGMSPALFFFHLKNVAELMPAFRQTSATDFPSSALLDDEHLLRVRKFRGFHAFSLLSQPIDLIRKTLTKIGGVFGDHICTFVL